MVRAVADRAFLPAKSLFEQAGNMMILTGKTITATVRPPYPYGGGFRPPFMTGVVVAGVAGTAITADLGARKIREELDALQVLGVDPIKNLVVPRFLALMLVTGLFDIYAVIFGIFGGILATVVNHAPLGPFFSTFFNNAETTDLWGSVVKTTR